MYKLLFILLIISNSSFGQSEYTKVVSFYNQYVEIFDQGSTQYLYGDNVKFRKKPSTESKVLDTLSIGSEVLILKKSKETMSYNGMNWNWYKVDHGGTIGYVLGALIAVISEEIDGDRYLISMSKNESEEQFAHYRLLTENGEYKTGKTELFTGAFTVHVHNDRGVEGIESMLFIDYYAEACGVDGGGIYIFYDGNNLKEAISVSSVSDGGVFWFSEELTFPNDEDGRNGVIIYEREHGLPVEENTNWYRSVINTIDLRWEEGAFTPNIDELDFDDE